MSLRRMTYGELTLARSIFENTIILMLFIVQIIHRKQCLVIVKQ